MIGIIAAGAAAAALAGLFAGAAAADGMVYSGFPVTVKGYAGEKTSSVAYTGQIARHALHDSLKKLAASGNGKPNPELKARMMGYFSGKDAGRKILAPATKGTFAILQSDVDAISRGKNLAGKTYKAAVAGMPNGMTGPELVALSTIHSAKGLEFDHVLLPGPNQEVTPHGTEDGDGTLDGLRRLVAMGIGRARRSVMIGYKPGEESTLIEMFDPETYELVRV